MEGASAGRRVENRNKNREEEEIKVGIEEDRYLNRGCYVILSFCQTQCGTRSSSTQLSS